MIWVFNMTYRHLIKDIQDIVDTAMLNKQTIGNLALTTSYWTIGKRLIQDEQQGESRAAYGQKTLNRLAEDLNNLYGKGFGRANLKYMRQFYKAYKKSEIISNLNWSHYKILLQIEDKKLRNELEGKIVRSRWSQRQLAEYVRELMGSTKPLSSDKKLKRPLGRVGIIQTRRVFQSGQEKVFIDLGFKIWLKATLNEMQGLKNKTLLEQNHKYSAKRIKPYIGSRKNMYVYKANLDHVIDGDTIVVLIDCGLDTCIQQSLRLRAVNALPLSEPDGIKAKIALGKLFNKVDSFLIKTSKRDKYARLVADVILPISRQIAPDTMENGLYLNQELLDRGLAERVTY